MNIAGLVLPAWVMTTSVAVQLLVDVLIVMTIVAVLLIAMLALVDEERRPPTPIGPESFGYRRRRWDAREIIDGKRCYASIEHYEVVVRIEKEDDPSRYAEWSVSKSCYIFHGVSHAMRQAAKRTTESSFVHVSNGDCPYGVYWKFEKMQYLLLPDFEYRYEMSDGQLTLRRVYSHAGANNQIMSASLPRSRPKGNRLSLLLNYLPLPRKLLR
jgi:hypothetical protein